MIFCCNWNLFILRHIYWKIHMKGSKTKIKQESTNKFQKISYLDPFLLTLCWDNFIPICIYSKKSCIQETLNLSTDADRSTNIFFSFLNFVAGRKKFEGVQPFFGFFFSADEKNLTVNNNKKMRGPKKWPGTDHVTWGPIRGLKKKTAPDGANILLPSDLENVTIHTIQDSVKFSGCWVKLVTEHTVFCRKLNLLSQFGNFWG